MLTLTNRRNLRVEDNVRLFDYLNDNSLSKYIFGATPFSKIACRNFADDGIEVNGVIDDFYPGNYFSGVKVFKLRDVTDKDALIIQCVGARPKTVYRYLLENGFRKILDYHLLYLRDERCFPLIHGGDNFQADFRINGDEYERIYAMLSDDTSKDVFKDLLELKQNLDVLASTFEFTVKNQYWEDFVGIHEVTTFADCGGFNGDSSLAFIRLQPNYEKIYLFEPFSFCIEEAKKNLKQFNNIEYFNIAVSDKRDKISFTDDLGVANHRSMDGKLMVETDKIDSLVKGNVDYIKLDVEGDELKALEGAQNLISNQKPKIAVAVYHKVEDIWKIPNFILSLNPKYKMFLRHYTEGLSESIMYFI
jgi:FkbM family methyltransferase